MSINPLKNLFVVAILFSLSVVIFPINLYSQGIKGAFGIRKNYDKEPDINEMQDPVNGEFRANPTYIASEKKDQRCNAVDTWISSIRFEAMNSSTYKNSKYMWQNGVFNVAKVDERDIKKNAAIWFENIFGSPLARLSEKNIERVAKDLNRCSHQRWVEYYLEKIFITPQAVAKWQNDFEQIKETNRKNKIEEKRQEALNTAKKSIGYPIDESLLQTAKFDVYTTIPAKYQSEWCSAEDGQAQISYVFKTSENTEIIIDDYYWSEFESKVLPIVKSRCSSADTILILHYVKGSYLYDDKVSNSLNSNFSSQGRRLRGSYNSGNLSQEISHAIYRPFDSGVNKHSWDYGNSFINSVNMPEDSTITSIAGIRDAFSVRQTKLDKEATIQKAEAVKRGMLREQEEVRLAKLRQQQLISENRTKHKKQASPVLVYLSQKAPKHFSFRGYKQSEALLNNYEGNFESFTGGLEKDQVESSSGNFIRLWLGGGSVQDAFNEVNKAAQIARLRLPIMIAYSTYHQVYEETCRSDKSMEWGTASFRTDTITKRGLIIINRLEGQTYKFDVRNPYGHTFVDTFQSANRNELAQYITGVSLNTINEFEADFRKLLKTQVCASPTVRNFEVNLYLATEWVLPHQEIMKAGTDLPTNLSRFNITHRTLTHLKVKKGQKISITATGSIRVGLFAGVSTPNGIGGFDEYSHERYINHGALMVRIKKSDGYGNWKGCGNSCSFNADNDGEIEFLVNDRDASNNSGSYSVGVQINN